MKTVIIAFAIALLSGMGVGSGGLLVTYLTLVESAPQLTAQGLNLLFFLFASYSSLAIHSKKRRLLVEVILIMGGFGVVGALLGSLAASHLPASLLSKLFGFMLTFSGILSLVRSKKRAKM